MGRFGRAMTGLAVVAALAGCSHHARGKHVKVAPLAPARLSTIGVNAYLWQASLDTIAFMPGEKHWHGAAPAHAMTHIAVHEAKDGVTVEWLEAVADSDYTADPQD